MCIVCIVCTQCAWACPPMYPSPYRRIRWPVTPGRPEQSGSGAVGAPTESAPRASAAAAAASDGSTARLGRSAASRRSGHAPVERHGPLRGPPRAVPFQQLPPRRRDGGGGGGAGVLRVPDSARARHPWDSLGMNFHPTQYLPPFLPARQDPECGTRIRILGHFAQVCSRKL